MIIFSTHGICIEYTVDWESYEIAVHNVRPRKTITKQVVVAKMRDTCTKQHGTDGLVKHGGGSQSWYKVKWLEEQISRSKRCLSILYTLELHFFSPKPSLGRLKGGMFIWLRRTGSEGVVIVWTNAPHSVRCQNVNGNWSSIELYICADNSLSYSSKMPHEESCSEIPMSPTLTIFD